MKEMIKRAARTFCQAAAGYVAANIAAAVMGAGENTGALKTALLALVSAAVAAGIAAVMNLPRKETAVTVDSDPSASENEGAEGESSDNTDETH